jgi:Na+-translocating ferredoxin:NAD+ oxidoreductase RnfC subunit
MAVMARIIVLILMALLPLRGWSAVSMSVTMAAAQAQAISSTESVQPAAMADDCPMMQMAAQLEQDNTVSDVSPPDKQGHSGCQSCQLCMSLVAQEMPKIYLSEAAPLSLASASSTRYISAELLSDSKPPIA